MKQFLKFSISLIIITFYVIAPLSVGFAGTATAVRNPSAVSQQQSTSNTSSENTEDAGKDTNTAQNEASEPSGEQNPSNDADSQNSQSSSTETTEDASTSEQEFESEPEPEEPSDPFAVESTNAILVETTTNSIIFQKDIHEQVIPGEITKLMTAIIASEYSMPDDIVTVSEGAVSGSQSYNTVSRIKTGEQLTIRQLLYCLILDGSDIAAAAIAEHISGSQSEFAKLMNEKAKFIGAENTNFTNATGQNNENQYSTVWDLYIISEYFMQNKQLMTIASSKNYTLPQSEWREKNTRFYTNNHLLSTYKNRNYYYRYADGLIGGYSSASGSVISAAASRGQGSMSLVFIGVGAKTEESEYSHPAFKDAVNVFTEAYSSYKIQTIVKKGAIMQEASLAHSFEKDYISLVAKEDVSAAIPKDKNISDYTIKILPKEKIMAPINPGDSLGTFEVYDGDILLVIGTLTSQETIRANLLLKIGYWIQTFFSFTAVKVIIVLLIILAIGYIVLTIRVNRRRREILKLNKSKDKKRLLK